MNVSFIMSDSHETVYIMYWFGCVTPVRVKACRSMDEAIAFGGELILNWGAYVDMIDEEEYLSLDLDTLSVF